MTTAFQKNLTQEYWDKLLDDNFSLKGVGWPNWPESYNLILYKKYLKGFDEVINDLETSCNFTINEKIKVFEAGPGTGFYTTFFWKANVKDYVGCDISEISIVNLRNKFPGFNFLRKDISINDDFIKSNIEKFDLINIVDVFLHITDDIKFRSAVSNLAKMLKPGGFIIIGDPITIYRVKSHSEGSKYTHDVSRNIEYVKEIFSKYNIHLFKIYQRYNFLLNKNFDFKYRFFEKIFNVFFYLLNGGLSVFRNSNFIGKLVGYPLSFFDSIITPVQKYSKNSKFLLMQKAHV